MRVVEIRQEGEFDRLQADWQALVESSVSGTIFLTWEWVKAWWRAYGEPGALRILAAYDEGGVLRGLAPLRHQALRRYGRRVDALSFIGDGSADSDYLDLLMSPGHEQQVLASFEPWWLEQTRRGTVLQFGEIPESSAAAAFLRTMAARRHLLCRESETPCGALSLPADWDAYLSRLRPRFRTKVRSVLRNLESRPEVRFGFCRTQDEVDRLLPALFDLHTRRWNRDGKPGVFGWNRKRDFYRMLSKVLLERGWLRFSWMEWSGRILACQYGFAYRGTYFHLQEGYEPACEHWNIGMGLRARSIQELQREGIREYDFLGGMGRHKSDWGAEVKISKQMLLADVNRKNLLFCHGPLWESRVRETARKWVPEKMLAARRARVEKAPEGAEAQPGDNGNRPSAGGWVRTAAAKCYFHLRLPAMLRPLRDRYQLSISNGGKWPKVSWDKRREATGRILYYHRVNDDGDRFFPAISTELFEQQMRFVARHYQVVSLAELQNRLEDGSPQPVMAITFDDGYQDNYHNAFPILQRYGLPATIFLTTGSVDSGEPLWFERLAIAAKKTSREFIDLEIDIPRRFWMRTEAERLHSSREMFLVLKDLPDSERRRRLDEILRLCGDPDDSERRNKLLSWDQIRRMKAHGIDFGGHTVTHPFLARMGREEVMWEATECKKRIEDQLQSPAHYFAYPNGREEDFGPSNKELIRSAGYRAAVTTVWGLNYRSTDPMELRRGGPWEQMLALYAYKLDWYQLVNG
jgi:peptidoglycan/xylan/chitin deacetylase (PgdA/CDA1 family)/CelD/BcsL family acetyltransferase involved in cellulose biosynthesis